MPIENQAVKIVYSKTSRAHLILRTVPAEKLKWTWSQQQSRISDYFNLLVSARSLDGLLKAAEKLPPIVPSKRFGALKTMYEIGDLSADFFSSLRPCDVLRLKDESYLESCRPIRSNTSRLDSFIKKWGSNGNELEKLTEQILSRGGAIVVEPLQDWAFLRNSLSICARLIAECQSDIPDLKRCGFIDTYSSRLQRKLLCAPIKYNTFFSKPISTNSAQSDPLYHALTKAIPQKTNIPLTKVDVNLLNPKDEAVFITTKPIATGDSKISPENGGENKTLFLCVRDNGNDADMARSIVSSFGMAYRNLSIPLGIKEKEGKLDCGWSYDESGEFEELDSPRVYPQSLASALWYRLVYHPEDRLSRCKWCEGAFLSKRIGATREFCSGSCRVQFGRKYPGGRNDD